MKSVGSPGVMVIIVSYRHASKRATEIYVRHKKCLKIWLVTCPWPGNKVESKIMHCDAKRAAYEQCTCKGDGQRSVIVLKLLHKYKKWPRDLQMRCTVHRSSAPSTAVTTSRRKWHLEIGSTECDEWWQEESTAAQDLTAVMQTSAFCWWGHTNSISCMWQIAQLAAPCVKHASTWC